MMWPLPQQYQDWRSWAAKLIQGLLSEREQAKWSKEVTLRASQTTTVITDARIGGQSVVVLTALTSAAAAAQVAGIYYTVTRGSLTINHASNAAADQTFRVALL